MLFFLSRVGVHRDLHGQTQSFPTRRTSVLVSEVDPSREYIPGTGDAPKAVRQTIIDSLSDAEAAGRNEAAAKARLEGFGDLLLDSAIFRGRRGQEIGQIGGFARGRSEEHTSELQSLMRISYAVFCLKK